MITDHRKFTTSFSSLRGVQFPFLSLESIQSLSLTVRCVQERHLPQFWQLLTIAVDVLLSHDIARPKCTLASLRDSPWSMTERQSGRRRTPTTLSIIQYHSCLVLLLMLLLLLSIWRIEWRLADVVIYTAHEIGCSYSSISSSTKQEWYWIIDSVVGVRRLPDCFSVIPWLTKGNHATRPFFKFQKSRYLNCGSIWHNDALWCSWAFWLLKIWNFEIKMEAAAILKNCKVFIRLVTGTRR